MLPSRGAGAALLGAVVFWFLGWHSSLGPLNCHKSTLVDFKIYVSICKEYLTLRTPVKPVRYARTGTLFAHPHDVYSGVQVWVFAHVWVCWLPKARANEENSEPWFYVSDLETREVSCKVCPAMYTPRGEGYASSFLGPG